MAELLNVQYAQKGNSTKPNGLGMREMQARAYEKRNAQYLLLKAPPASGKSRALMFLALDKLHHQDIRKVIIAVPEMSIGGSFANTDLTESGFFADWVILPHNNLCLLEGNDKSKVQAFKHFMKHSEEQILLCTHATLRFACEELNPQDFDRTLVAIDEFHHVSAHENNRLGEKLDQIMNYSSAHIIAMTGSYFRGDAMPILTAEDEAKFDQVVYTYYEQLNGYRYLKSLGLGYHFYRGQDGYFSALAEVLDLSKKTIIHIPNVNSSESTKRKYEEVDRILDLIGEVKNIDPISHIFNVITKDGKHLKVADLVNDDPEIRPLVMDYLRNIKNADDIDIIIALGMAKEGFDWQFCEHALTIGYRSSLTEVVQIIGRATRDCEGKSHAQFTNLIAQPDAQDEDVRNAVNSLLKAITLSLLMEQVLAPNITFRRRSDVKADEPLPAGTIIVDDTTMKPSDRVMKILNGGKEEIISALLQSDRGKGILTQAESPEMLSEIVLPQVIKQRYPDLTDDELEQVHSGMLQALAINTLGGVINGNNLPENAMIDGIENPTQEYIVNNQFVKMGEKFINVDDLNIDLIAQINPFQQAYEILSKSITPEMLKTIQTVANSNKITMAEEEALMLWERIKDFIRKNQRQPTLTANDPLERRMAEALIFLRNEKMKRIARGI
ncbi:DEAD/DEAH box helicase [Rodentibacter ratti]|uniref:ATP-dependent helicase n=1 Tax=Rodentibacter ratti TaxID=1906745 RepID=A0A1V3LCH2_9PAST|nr:DEAD/DEAH box helicase family protein [Rodentibacter ratti]OOF87448.1 ATP-dependent helicase [Rodentibacter ratti]